MICSVLNTFLLFAFDCMTYSRNCLLWKERCTWSSTS